MKGDYIIRADGDEWTCFYEGLRENQIGYGLVGRGRNPGAALADLHGLAWERKRHADEAQQKAEIKAAGGWWKWITKGAPK